MADPRLLHASVLAVAAGLLSFSCKKKPEQADKPKAVDSSAQEVRCEGANACKGQSACHTAESACAGQNTCKGKGWVAMARKECVAQGGKVGEGPTQM